MSLKEPLLGRASSSGDVGRFESLDTKITSWEIRLRRRASFHFLNPYQKWKMSGKIPWKLVIQVLKIFLVTAQVSLFGALRSHQSDYYDSLLQTFSHLLIKDWPGYADVHVYPPPGNIHSVYTKDDLRETVAFAVDRYNRMHSLTLNVVLKQSRAMRACAVTNLNGSHWQSSESAVAFAFEKTPRKLCQDIRGRQEALDFVDRIVGKFDSLILSADVRTFRLPTPGVLTKLACNAVRLSLTFQDVDRSGRLKVRLAMDLEEMAKGKCHGTLKVPNSTGVAVAGILCLDMIVLLSCLASAALCLRSLTRAALLSRDVNRFLEGRLGSEDKWRFISFWYIMIVTNDAIVCVGTAFKLSLDFETFDETKHTAASLCLGVGTLLVWSGVLRYLAFFRSYNLLILTMRLSLPNVLRFLLVAGLIYVGFVLCGWIVLGPYSIKFQDPLVTSECLFSILTGDSVFITFYTIENPDMRWFAQIFIYSFGIFFILVVASVFNMIILGAYTVVTKDAEKPKPSLLEEFITDKQS